MVSILLSDLNPNKIPTDLQNIINQESWEYVTRNILKAEQEFKKSYRCTMLLYCLVPIMLIILLWYFYVFFLFITVIIIYYNLYYVFING